jgi:signal transduction histidine kinase
MANLELFIKQHQSDILDRWSEHAGQAPWGRGLSNVELLGIMPAYLSLLGRTGVAEVTQLSDAQQNLLERHLSHRLRDGFELNEIVFEFALLARCISMAIESTPSREHPPAAEVARALSELHLTTLGAAKIFREQLLEDEQREKRYARLISNLAADALSAAPDALPLRERLHEVVELIMEAMSARTASLLLRDRRTGTLKALASAGIADEQLAEYAAMLAPYDAKQLEVSHALRQSGIHSLLGIRLPAGHALEGVLCIGIARKGEFTPSERRRLASLCDRLTLHLDNAQLVADLRHRVATLGVFVDAIAHIERMVGDLQGAQRSAAGLSELDLTTVAREVADELNEQYPHRVVVQATGGVRGVWDRDQLRRSLLNLGENGLKYGDPNAPVVISLRERPDGAEFSVHSEELAAAVDERRRLFSVGIALVRGAMQAHGGDVEVSSAAGRGTTVRVTVPHPTHVHDETTAP